MNRFLQILGLGAALLLSGCLGTGGETPVQQTYTLAAPNTAPANAAATPMAVLAVLTPDTAAGLHGDHIALLQSGHRLDYFAGARWSGPLPDLVQTLAAEALQGGGQFRSVQADSAPFAADYELQLQVRHFEADYSTGNPVAHVTMDAILGRSADRSIVQTLKLESSVAAASDRLGPIINAFQQATADALQQLATQLKPPN